MISLQRTFTVTPELCVVQAYLSDFTHAQDWDPGTISCIRIGNGPIQVGTSWRNVSEFRGRRTELHYRLTRLEPGRLTFEGRNKTVTSTDDISLRQRDGTEITYLATLRFHGLSRLAEPVLRRTFAQLGEETRQSLINTLNDLPEHTD